MLWVELLGCVIIACSCYSSLFACVLKLLFSRVGTPFLSPPSMHDACMTVFFTSSSAVGTVLIFSVRCSDI